MSAFIVNIDIIVDFCHIDAAVLHFVFHLQFQLLSGFHGDPFVFSMDGKQTCGGCHGDKGTCPLKPQKQESGLKKEKFLLMSDFFL